LKPRVSKILILTRSPKITNHRRPRIRLFEPVHPVAVTSSFRSSQTFELAGQIDRCRHARRQFAITCDMPTLIRFDGLRVVVYPADHRPPHGHVIGRRNEAVFQLAEPGYSVVLRENIGFGRTEIALIRRRLELEIPKLRAATTRSMSRSNGRNGGGGKNRSPWPPATTGESHGS
jgi:hypothetical protein